MKKLTEQQILDYLNNPSTINKLDLIEYELSEEFIDHFKYDLDWCDISNYQPLTKSFILKYEEFIDWGLLCYNKNIILSEEFLEKHLKKFDMYNVCRTQNLSNKFIHHHFDELDWEALSANPYMSEDFLIRYEHYIKWYLVGSEFRQQFSESFLERYFDRFNKDTISGFQNLSKEFIIKHLSELDLFYLLHVNSIIPKSTIEYIKMFI